MVNHVETNLIITSKNQLTGNQCLSHLDELLRYINIINMCIY